MYMHVYVGDSITDIIELLGTNYSAMSAAGIVAAGERALLNKLFVYIDG